MSRTAAGSGDSPTPPVEYWEHLLEESKKSNDRLREQIEGTALRLEAMLKWLLEDGHITAQGARQIRKIIEAKP